MTTLNENPRQESETTVDRELALLALAAGESVAPYLKRVARSKPDFDTKRDFHDPVTVHDKHVEDELRKFLTERTPGCRFLGEEMGESDPGVPASNDGGIKGLGSRLRWIIDPIDGTANFASGLIYFNTSIAAELDGEVVAGSVTVPAVGEAFVADSHRAWHIAADGTETEMHADGPRSEATALLATYYPSLGSLVDYPEETARHDVELMSSYGTVRRPGAAALDLAHVAAGWLGALLGIGFSPWDVAAGIHMVKVAGGKVLNLPLDTDLPDGLRPAVVAEGRSVNAETARRVLEEINARY